MDPGSHIQMPSDMTWDLSELYGGVKDPRLHQDLQRAETEALTFRTAYQPRLTRNDLHAPGLALALKEYESIHEMGLRPYLFAYLYAAAQTHDPQGIALLKKTKQRWNDILDLLSFFEPGLMELPEGVLERLAHEPPLTDYRQYLLRLLQKRPHGLPEPEERLLKRQRLSGRDAFISLFDEVMGSLNVALTLDGQPCQVHMDQLLALRNSPDLGLRHEAHRRGMRKLSESGVVFKNILNAVVMDHVQESRLRKYPSFIHQSLALNDMDGECMEAMMSEVETHYPLARKYFALKAEGLGVKRLRTPDLMAPMGEGLMKIPLEKAEQLLLEWAEHVHPIFHSIVREVFKRRRIDAQARAEKKLGAFCECFAPSHPAYISMRYDGSVKNLMTLAHEVGHAVHYRLAAEQGYLNFRPPPILAETGAVFFETLFCHYLMKKAEFQKHGAAIRSAYVDEIILCVFRQHVLTRFEQAVHTLRQDHFLDEAEICDLWRAQNEKLYEDCVDTIPEDDWGWAYIPHFIHHPFYCYSYIFGALLSLSLLKAYEEDPQDTLNKVTGLLQSGGSRALLEMISEMGINPGSDAFYRQAFRRLKEMIEGLGTLIE